MNWNAQNRLFPIAVFLLSLLILTSCFKKQSDSVNDEIDSAQLTREKTLYISGFQ